MIRDKRRGLGVSLKGSIWERLDKIADDRDMTISQVIESVLEEALPLVQDSTNMADIPAIRGTAIFRTPEETDHEE